MTLPLPTTLHVCRSGPTEVRWAERGEPRWCFACRKRLAGTWEFVVEVEPGWYDPIWVYRCDGCKDDHRFFPGTGPW